MNILKWLPCLHKWKCTGTALGYQAHWTCSKCSITTHWLLWDLHKHNGNTIDLRK